MQSDNNDNIFYTFDFFSKRQLAKKTKTINQNF